MSRSPKQVEALESERRIACADPSYFNEWQPKPRDRRFCIASKRKT